VRRRRVVRLTLPRLMAWATLGSTKFASRQRFPTSARLGVSSGRCGGLLYRVQVSAFGRLPPRPARLKREERAAPGPSRKALGRTRCSPSRRRDPGDRRDGATRPGRAPAPGAGAQGHGHMATTQRIPGDRTLPGDARCPKEPGRGEGGPADDRRASPEKGARRPRWRRMFGGRVPENLAARPLGASSLAQIALKGGARGFTRWHHIYSQEKLLARKGSTHED
jgi:hypothetical protein